MSMLRGLLMIWSFSAVAGMLGGVNLVAYALATGTRPGPLILAACGVAGLLEAIGLLLLLDRAYHAKAVAPEVPAPSPPELADAKRELDA